MQQRWPLIVADYRREYHMDTATLGGLSMQEFTWLLQGLSKHSRFMRAWHDAPKNLYDRADIEAVKAAARR